MALLLLLLLLLRTSTSKSTLFPSFDFAGDAQDVYFGETSSFGLISTSKLLEEKDEISFNKGNSCDVTVGIGSGNIRHQKTRVIIKSLAIYLELIF